MPRGSSSVLNDLAVVMRRALSPGRHLSLDATGSYQDVRNRSAGTFAEYSGDRLPNRPWLFASFGAQSLTACESPWTSSTSASCSFSSAQRSA